MNDQHEKVAFVEINEVPKNFVLSQVTSKQKYKSLYGSHRMFTFVELNEIAKDDFLFVLSSGLYKVVDLASK